MYLCMPLFIKQANTQTMNTYNVKYTQQRYYVSPKNLYTPAGYEPGSSVSEGDVMSTAPRCQGCSNKFLLFVGLS
jgi:hypothetical protein